MTTDLSAFYFDIRKDALYCDPISSVDPQGLPHRARPPVPLHRDLARADAVLHRRGGLAARAIATARLGASRAVPRRADGLARRRAGREMAQGAAGAPRRHRRAGDRARAASASAPRSRPPRSSTSPTRTCSRRWSTSTSPRSASPRRRRWSKAKARREAFRLTRCAGVAVVCQPRRGPQMRALVENLARRRQRSRISRRHAARRAGAARMGRHAQGGGVSAARRRIPSAALSLGAAHPLRSDRRR